MAVLMYASGLELAVRRDLDLSGEDIVRMTREIPGAAARFHAALAAILAERLARTNHLLQQLS